MIGPLSSFGIVSGNISFLLAVIIGFFFGFFLERGGLGNPHKLTGVFYLTDFTVPKVMFTAIVTAGIGLYLMSDLKLLELSRIWIVPTFFWPQIIGGSLFGVGFVLSGYCPGTAVAGLGSGRIDALITLIGVAGGSMVFAVIYPILEKFYNSSAMGGVTLPKLMHLNHWLVLFLVLASAITMFIMLERFEKRHSAKAACEEASPESSPRNWTSVNTSCTSYY